MFKVLVSHDNSKDLTWTFTEFKKLVQSGDIRYPENYSLIIRIKLFKFTFNVPV